MSKPYKLIDFSHRTPGLLNFSAMVESLVRFLFQASAREMPWVALARTCRLKRREPMWARNLHIFCSPMPALPTPLTMQGCLGQYVSGPAQVSGQGVRYVGLGSLVGSLVGSHQR